MSKITVVFPTQDLTGDGGRLVQLTEEIEKRTTTEAVAGFLGGSYGYGIEFENDTFMMHPFCWCEREDCGWCAEVGAMPQLMRDALNVKYGESERLPNFLFKPTGGKVWWYKYIGRGMEFAGELPEDWYSQCLNSLPEALSNQQKARSNQPPDAKQAKEEQ